MRISYLLLLAGAVCPIATAQPYPDTSTDRHYRFEPQEAPFPISLWVKNTEKSIESSCKKIPPPFLSDQSTIKFTLMVDSSGKISSLTMENPSQNKEADEYYAQRIRQASPFSAAPKTLSEKAGAAINLKPKLYKGPFLISITDTKVSVHPVRQAK